MNPWGVRVNSYLFFIVEIESMSKQEIYYSSIVLMSKEVVK